MSSHAPLWRGKAPDATIGPKGEPRIYRWWVIPRNKWFNIYLHKLVGSDPRHQHDHPAWNLSIILKGQYVEWIGTQRFIRRPGDIIYRRAATPHRIEANESSPCWSLFINGDKKRVWGFDCPKAWVPHTYFRDKGVSYGEMGDDCGEYGDDTVHPDLVADLRKDRKK